MQNVFWTLLWFSNSIFFHLAKISTNSNKLLRTPFWLNFPSIYSFFSISVSIHFCEQFTQLSCSYHKWKTCYVTRSRFSKLQVAYISSIFAKKKVLEWQYCFSPILLLILTSISFFLRICNFQDCDRFIEWNDICSIAQKSSITYQI